MRSLAFLLGWAVFSLLAVHPAGSTTSQPGWGCSQLYCMDPGGYCQDASCGGPGLPCDNCWIDWVYHLCDDEFRLTKECASSWCWCPK